MSFINKITIFIMLLFSSKGMRRSLRSILKTSWKTNQIIITDAGKEYVNDFMKIPAGIKFRIKGENNTIHLELPIKAKNSEIIIENDNVEISIGRTVAFNSISIMCVFGDGQICKIGRNIASNGVSIYLSCDAQCIIGDDCMFSNSIKIKTTDAHTIMDKNTGEIINRPERPLIIGNHCWIGQAVQITKNATIPNHTIVGTASVVTKPFTEEYTAIAGNPGKVIRRNVIWDNRDIFQILKSES